MILGGQPIPKGIRIPKGIYLREKAVVLARIERKTIIDETFIRFRGKDDHRPSEEIIGRKRSGNHEMKTKRFAIINRKGKDIANVDIRLFSVRIFLCLLLLIGVEIFLHRLIDIDRRIAVEKSIFRKLGTGEVKASRIERGDIRIQKT